MNDMVRRALRARFSDLDFWRSSPLRSFFFLRPLMRLPMERTRSDRLLLVADVSLVLMVLVAPCCSPVSLLMTSIEGAVSDESLLFMWLDGCPLVRGGAARLVAVGSYFNVDAANVTLGPLDTVTNWSACVVFLTGIAYKLPLPLSLSPF